MNIRKAIFYLLGILPWTFILSLLSFYIHASYMLGRTPTYAHPDPGQLSVYSFYGPLINSTSILWLYSLLVWFCFTVAYIFRKRKDLDMKPIGLGFISQITAFFLFISEINHWYMD